MLQTYRKGKMKTTRWGLKSTLSAVFIAANMTTVSIKREKRSEQHISLFFYVILQKTNGISHSNQASLLQLSRMVVINTLTPMLSIIS